MTQVEVVTVVATQVAVEAQEVDISLMLMEVLIIVEMLTEVLRLMVVLTEVETEVLADVEVDPVKEVADLTEIVEIVVGKIVL